MTHRHQYQFNVDPLIVEALAEQVDGDQTQGREGRQQGCGRALMTSKEFPRWVEDELWNWSRWCWEGESPVPVAPSRCVSLESSYVAPEYEPEQDEQYQDSPYKLLSALCDQQEEKCRYIAVDRALRVKDLYEQLPLLERRMVQAEYTRRHDFQGMTGLEREVAASRRLCVSRDYYKIALHAFKVQIWEEFK